MVKPNLVGKMNRDPSPSGGHNTWHTGIRPVFQVLPEYLTSGEVEFLEPEQLAPGGQARAQVRLITPEAYPHSVEIGQSIPFGEGSKVRGTFTVEKILDPVLRKIT